MNHLILHHKDLLGGGMVRYANWDGSG